MRPFDIVNRLRTTALFTLVLSAGTTHAGVGDQIAKLLPAHGAYSDAFGSSVAMGDAITIVGAPFDDKLGTDSGSAFLYDTRTGMQIAKLQPEKHEIGGYFGYSVAIEGAVAIVGAPSFGDNLGAAYFFDTSTGEQIGNLIHGDFKSINFGWSVAISGTTAVIGAPFSNDNGFFSGSAFVFDMSTGMQIAKLLPSDGAPVDLFGSRVAISGTTAIVGAQSDDDNGFSSGSVYLFDTSTGMQIAKLLPDDGTAGDLFGFPVAVSGTTLLIGAHRDAVNGTDSGSAYVFDLSTGMQISKLLPNDGAANDYFGYSVAISGTTALIGARHDGDNGFESGSAYLFDAITGLQIAKILPSDGGIRHYFGISVGISGSTIIAGAPGDTDNGIGSGSSYLFEGLRPALVREGATISLGTGGRQSLLLDGGAIRAGWFYNLFGSVTGTTPGLNFGSGVVLPLNFDVYFNLTLTKPGLSAFGNFAGMLDGSGQALATFKIPAGAEPGLAGVTLDHAHLAARVLGFPEFASNAVSLTFVP